MTQTIISWAIAFIFGIWAVRLAIKQLYPGRITFVQENCIALFDSIVKNLPELAINYKRKPIKENLVLLKGFFVNTGTIDISTSMVEDKLTVKLPNNYKWLTAKVISASEHLRVTAKISDKTNLMFDIAGLFKREEFVHFEALAEVPIDKNGDNAKKTSQNKKIIKPAAKLTAALKFYHRIANTKKVNKKDLSKIDKTPSQFFAALACFLLILVAIGSFFAGLPTKTNFIMKTEDNKTIEVSVQLKADGNLLIKGVDGDYKKVLPVSVFLDKKPSPKIIVDPEFKIAVIIIASFILLILLVAVITFLEYRLYKRLKDIVLSST